MKTKFLVITALLGLGTVMGLSSGISANAATWHRGTPSFLRGKYRKHIGSIGWPHKVKNYDWVTIGKNSIVQEAGVVILQESII